MFMCYVGFVNLHVLGLYEINCIRLGFGQVRSLNEERKNFGETLCRRIWPQIQPVLGRINRGILESGGMATASNSARNPGKL